MTKVFISYSHDSDAHRDFVRGVSDRLRADGLDCQIDQYINGFPPEGWQRWMETQVEVADFVLLVCTPDYLKRFRGLETDGGRGVNFEGVVISQTLYDHYYRNTKFVPVILEGRAMTDVPLPLKGFSVFQLMVEYESLYRFLSGQAAVVAPVIGDKLVLENVSRSPYEKVNDRWQESLYSFIKNVIHLSRFEIISLSLVLLFSLRGDSIAEVGGTRVYVKNSKGFAVPYVSLSFAGKIDDTDSNGLYFNESRPPLQGSILMVAKKDGYYEWRDFVNFNNPLVEIVLNEK